jgi:hypothetical protein
MADQDQNQGQQGMNPQTQGAGFAAQNAGQMPPPANQAGAQMPFPPAGQTGTPVPPGMPVPPKEDLTPANYEIGKALPQVIGIKIPAHSLQFDEQYFLHLLAGSISLSRDEKKRIIESIPRLKQSQVDELIRIFEEERRKFAELSGKHVEQLKKLEKQHLSEWQDLEVNQKAESKKGEDEAKAEEIRKKLGL